MKIAFVIPEITGKGGVEKVTQLLSDAFARQGIDVTVISLFRNNQNYYFPLSENVECSFMVNEIYDNNKVNKLKKIKLLFKGRSSLKSYLQNNKFDLIIAQTALPAFLLLSLGYRKNTIVCEHYKYELYSGLITKLRNLVYSKLLKVITLTETDANKYKSKRINAVTIPNMTSFPINQPKGKDSKRIISVGRLSNQKGYDLLVEAYKKVKLKHPDWKVDIFGDGELYTFLTNMTKEADVDDVIHFKGSTSKVREELCDSAIYVMSSRFEGFPMVLLEAMSCGLPIISFSCPEGPAELLINNSGILVKSEDTDGLALAINDLIENEELRNELSKNAIKEIKKYSPENIISKWMDLFKLLNLMK